MTIRRLAINTQVNYEEIKMENISHSAIGTHWFKKDHKYLRKEGNKYIYANDVKNGRRVGGGSNSNHVSDTTKDVSTNRNVNGRRVGGGNVNHVETTKRMNDQDSLNQLKRSNAAYSQNTPDYKQLSYYKSQSTYHSSKPAQQRARIARDANEFVDHKKKVETLRNQALLKRATDNRSRSHARTARELISENNTRRVAYRNKPNGNVERVVSYYGNNGGRSNVVQTGRSARDIVSEQGTRRVSYVNDGKNRFRAVTDSNFDTTRTQVDKTTGAKDKRGTFAKSIKSFASKIGIGRTAIDRFKLNVSKDSKKLAKERSKWEKIRAKEAKQQAKAQEKALKAVQRRNQIEYERSLPLKERHKRNVARGRRALEKFFNIAPAPSSSISVRKDSNGQTKGARLHKSGVDVEFGEVKKR